VDRPADSEGRRLPALKVEDLHKTFRIPKNRVTSLKERVVRPFSAREYDELHALDGISFEIGQGEFFGIVGRNGSGKSTLLKLLASIYRADSGTIRMAGRLAPFIELGVGFNEELTARENVVLNGVMMGLTPQETRSRLGAILEFAELDEFVDLKLKNYSSGMLVRLAFSVMMQADADILLVDEVLAVGDAAFQQKCADAFHEMKELGKTIILVTHEMSSVEAYCHRAMLIDGGKIQYLGDPAEVGRRYLRLNFERGAAATSGAAPEQSNEVRLVSAALEGAGGEEETNVEFGEKIRLRAEFETLEDAAGYGVGFMLVNADGIGVFHFGEGRVRKEDGSSALRAGERFRIEIEIDNLLAPGRYSVHCGVNRAENGSVALYVHDAFGFVVYGGDPHLPGIVRLPHEVSSEVRSEERA
jgi:ABC-2 type transport system ATP-binding protein